MVICKDFHFIITRIVKRGFGMILASINYKRMKWRQSSPTSITLIDSTATISELHFNTESQVGLAIAELKAKRTSFLKAELMMLAGFVVDCLKDSELVGS